MKYFYVLMRDKSIHEVEYTPEKYFHFIELWNKGGTILINKKGASSPMAVNSVDLSMAMDEEQYQQWIYTTNPKQYIKNGTWYDGKEHRFVRNEPWKQKQVDETLQLNAPTQFMTEADKEKANEARKRIATWMKEYFPGSK